MSLCANNYCEMVKPVPTKTHNIPSFLLAENLSPKQIVPTDNMQAKSDNAKRHHRWLKG